MRAMKDSGVEWIGDIPEEWEVINPKVLYQQRKAKAEAGQRQLTASQQHGIVYQDEYMRMSGSKVVTVEKDFDILKQVESGDFVISMRSFQGGIEYSPYRGSISSAYVMLIPNPAFVHSPFYKWLLKSSEYIKALQSTSNMVRDGQAMRYSNFAQVRLITLPKKEQEIIASLLDTKCAEIDKVVEQTRTTIEGYKKLKQAIITEAVTKGVRGPRPMKPSGVEWIGDIPEEWDISKAGRFISRIESGVSVNAGVAPAGEGELGVLKTSCVSTGKFNPDENKAVNQDEVLRVACPVQRGCLIVSRMNTPDLVGACGYVEESQPSIYLPDRLWQVSIKPDYLAKFVYYYLISRVARCYYASVAVGTSSSMQNISQKQFSDMRCTCPSLPEQQEIVAYLDTKCAEIDRIIGKKEQLIAELERYKKSLIYEYVTGKKQVLYK